MRLHIPPYYPLPRMVLEKELLIQQCTWDAKCKSWAWLLWLSHPILRLPMTLPMPILMTKEEERWF